MLTFKLIVVLAPLAAAIFPLSSFASEAKLSDDGVRPLKVSQIKEAWRTQATASNSLEIASTATVDISQSFLDAFAQQMRAIGREMRKAPTHRDEHLRLIFQGPRVLVLRQANGEKDTAFFNGKQYRSLYEPTQGNASGIVTVNKSDLRSSLTLPALLVFRGMDETGSGIRIDDFHIVEANASLVTLLSDRSDVNYILELDPVNGFMPVSYSRVRREDDKKVFEVKITYRRIKGVRTIFEKCSDPLDRTLTANCLRFWPFVRKWQTTKRTIPSDLRWGFQPSTLE